MCSMPDPDGMLVHPPVTVPALVAQGIERLPPEQKVVGSNPIEGTIEARAPQREAGPFSFSAPSPDLVRTTTPRYAASMSSREPSSSAVPRSARTVRVRRADLSDADGIWPLVSAFATTFSPHERAFRASLPRVLADDRALVVVADDGHTIVGYLCASAHLTFLADGEVAWVEELMVAEPRRRTGVGAALMACAEAWADERGAAYVSLASRRAGAFYAALGYEESATFYRKMCTTPGGRPAS